MKPNERRTSIDIPQDIWQDLQLRKFRGEGSNKGLLLYAYRMHFKLPIQEKKGEPNEETKPVGELPPQL